MNNILSYLYYNFSSLCTDIIFSRKSIFNFRMSSNAPRVCRYCGKLYRSISGLHSHEASHRGIAHFNCFQKHANFIRHRLMTSIAFIVKTFTCNSISTSKKCFPPIYADMINLSWFAQNTNLVIKAICSKHGITLMSISV